METFILAALAAMFLWGFGDFFLSRSVKRTGNFLPLIFIGFIGAVAFAPKAIPLLKYISGYELVFLILIGLLHVGMDYFLFEGFRRGKLSVIIVLFQLEIPLTVFFASVFLKETISPTMILFFALLLIGSFLLARGYLLRKSLFEKGWWLAIVGAIFCALVNVTTASASKTISPLLAIWFSWVTVFFFSLIFLWKEYDHVIKKAKENIIILVVVALFQVFAWLSFSYALSGRGLAIVAGITASYCVISAFLGYWVNDEELTRWQIVGAILSLIVSIIFAIIYSI